MKWAVELLTPKVVEVLDPEEKEIWYSFDSQIKRMIVLANSLSRISEVETGLFPIKPEKFVPSEVIDIVTKEFIEKIENKKLQIVKKYSGPKTISHDKGIFEIILDTLISNAVNYSPQNGTIEISVTDQPNSFIVNIADTATKIPDEQRDKMFTHLFRSDEAVRLNPEGLGLSLYLTKLLVGQIKGKIWYQPNSGSGNTFSVEIPKSL